MINAAFILKQDAFDSTYGTECVDAVARLAQVVGPTPCTVEQLTEASTDWLAEVDVLFTGWGSPVLDAVMLARMPRLRVVFYGAGTVRFMLTDACWDRDLIIVNAAEQNAIPTAEFATGAILLALKRVWHLRREVRRERNFGPASLQLPGGCGSVIGLVSLGLVGRRVAERLAGVDATFLVHDPYVDPDLVETLGCQLCTLDDIFRRSDVISLHTPLSSETTGFIDGRLLRLMKPGATFINTARGALINERDLLDVLQARPDLQAVIDVTAPEPPAPNSRFYELPNIFLTPHIAGSMGMECRRMGRAMVEQFRRYMAGEPLQQVVTREELGRRA